MNSTTILDTAARLLVVAHDAGGAEVVAAWVRRHPEYRYTFVIAGPAAKVFERCLGVQTFVPESSLTLELVTQHDMLLAATGWASDMEVVAIRMAREAGIFSVAYLDHWSNYAARFELDGQAQMPDEIWVGDERAQAIARDVFQNAVIRLEPNAYFQDIRDQFQALQVEAPVARGAAFRVLYLCEAIGEAGRRGADGDWVEFESLRLCIAELQRIFERRPVVLELRTHPAEATDKYDDFLGNTANVEVVLSEELDLVRACAGVDWVVGMNSMALVVAVLGQKPVFYCNPGGEMPRNLPADGMKNLFDVPVTKSERADVVTG